MFAYFRRLKTVPGCLSFFLILIIQIISIPAAATKHNGAGNDSAMQLLPWFQIGGYALHRQRGEGALWMPFLQDGTQVLFGEVKGKLFEYDIREGNFALGYRAKAGTDWVLGAWTGYDIRQSRDGNIFHQIAGGFEALSHNFDFRANWYAPLNRTEITSSSFTTSSISTSQTTAGFDEQGVSLFTTTTTQTTTNRTVKKEHALYGVDAEIGLRVPLENMFASDASIDGWWKKNELRVYAGGYYFDSPDVDQAVYGPRVRLEWRINDVIPDVSGSRLTFEAAYQYDKKRSDQFEVGLRLRLPFSNDGWGNKTYPQMTYQERRMSDSIQRDTDIVATKKDKHSRDHKTRTRTTRERALDDATGTRFDRVRIVDASRDLNRELTQAGGNSLVIATARRGAYVNHYATMLDNQTLMSSGSSIVVRGSRSGRTAVLRVGGQRATIQQTTNDEVLVVGSNNHVTGFDFVGGGAGAGHFNRGISTIGRNQENIVIDNVNIRNTDGHGITFNSGIKNWAVRNATIAAITDGNGIDIEDRNSNFEISNVEFADISLRSGDAIHISGFNSGTISNNTFGPGIADRLIRVKRDNVLTGSGNINLGGNEIYQIFGNNNQLSVGFN